MIGLVFPRSMDLVAACKEVCDTGPQTAMAPSDQATKPGGACAGQETTQVAVMRRLGTVMKAEAGSGGLR